MIYLDHNAASPLRPEVLESMRPFFADTFANPASSHKMGWQASQAVEDARASIVKHIGAATDPKTLIFTSGTTESINLALTGAALALAGGLAHFISVVTEHSCVLQTLKYLERQGHEVTLLKVDSAGMIALDDLRRAFKKNTLIVSVMHANNETGVLQNIGELTKITHEHGALFHTDAAQSIGKTDFDVANLDVDLASFSTHKIGGPKGIGCLYIAPRRPRIRIHPMVHGGGHESGLRSGTLNVPAIIGMARALELCAKDLDARKMQHALWLTDFCDVMQKKITDVFLNSVPNQLPNTINLGFMGVRAEDLIMALPEFCFATGAACASHSTEPSHVLMAMGRSAEEAQSSIRVSLGWNSSRNDLQALAQALMDVVPRLRQKSPSYQMKKS